jgi:hypothetical protein
MVSVIMPLAVWREVAGGADPPDWLHRTLEVQATPQPIGTKFINLSIATADQLQSDAR